MGKTIITQGLFAPNPSKQESKAKATSDVARTIMDAETRAREAKTARLRDLRLQKQADTPAPPVKKSRVKAR